MKKSLNELRDEAWANAEAHGFHEEPINFAERLMLVVSELAEALEAHELHLQGRVEDEIADALIRILDLAGIYKVDLEFHVAAKMQYNEGRPYKHGKKYG